MSTEERFRPDDDERLAPPCPDCGGTPCMCETPLAGLVRDQLEGPHRELYDRLRAERDRWKARALAVHAAHLEEAE